MRVTSPCPIELDPQRAWGGEKRWHCGHCKKNVHALSTLTEREARALLAANVGEDLCVTYLAGRDGSIRFRPEPSVPLVAPSTLVRARAAVAAVGVSVALAACAPHASPELGPEIVLEDPSFPEPTPTIPEARAQPTAEPQERLFADEIQRFGGGVRPMRVPRPPMKGIR